MSRAVLSSWPTTAAAQHGELSFRNSSSWVPEHETPGHARGDGRLRGEHQHHLLVHLRELPRPASPSRQVAVRLVRTMIGTRGTAHPGWPGGPPPIDAPPAAKSGSAAALSSRAPAHPGPSAPARSPLSPPRRSPPSETGSAPGLSRRSPPAPRTALATRRAPPPRPSAAPAPATAPSSAPDSPA